MIQDNHPGPDCGLCGDTHEIELMPIEAVGVMSPCPECCKEEYNDAVHVKRMILNRAEAETIGSFIEWLGENNKAICKRSASAFWRRDGSSIENLLMQYFHIDGQAVERHRRRVLEKLQQSQEGSGT